MKINSNSIVSISQRTMKDQLTEIDKKDLPLLRDLYKPGNSRDYIAFVTIDTYIRWFEQDPNIKHLNFYCLNGDFSRGTFVVTNRELAYANTFNESDDELVRLLLLLDYSKGFFFTSINERVSRIVREIVNQKGIEFQFDDSTLTYYLPKEDALKFDVQPPDGIELKPVTKRCDIEKAYSVWPPRCRTTLEFMIRQAKHNPSVGAFTEDGTLVAWVFRYSTGLLCALQTDENYYGHGYGSLVTEAISKKIAEMGHDLYAGIFESNTASRKLFGKLGYKSVGRVYWPTTK